MSGVDGEQGSGSPAPCCLPARGATPGPVEVSRRSGGSGGADGPRLLDLPGGRFAMGYEGPLARPEDGEGPVREVVVAPFRIGATPVTNAEFAAFVAATGHTTVAEREGWSFVFHLQVGPRAVVRGRAAGVEWWIAVQDAAWSRPGGAGTERRARPDLPVVHVAAPDAEAYAAWCGARLPTESEWEYAARGGLPGALYPWGDEHPLAGPARCVIWEGDFPHRHRRGQGAVGPGPVGAGEPNGFGLQQVVGNVWEWTATDAGPEVRIRRGGSYLCHDSYCNRYRVSARDRSHVLDTAGNLGFRIAADART
ncbi:SUMF1/EgtB/PvdO family nonheme iron enzyme [Nocardioides sp.]|uniref:SUMF1/EgtB/PvdO family nonheme iron enzyme n=1 Tax=Nocardioides sp. TaxID=35761 RepID=UPI0035133A41